MRRELDARAVRYACEVQVGEQRALPCGSEHERGDERHLDVARFESADKLQSYLGLVPREYSSGEKQQRGHITKAGNRRLRCLLVECAWGILRRRNPKRRKH